MGIMSTKIVGHRYVGEKRVKWIIDRKLKENDEYAVWTYNNVVMQIEFSFL